MDRLEVSQLDVLRIVFELRYPRSFLLWDLSGQVWTQLGSFFPNLAIEKAEPNNTTLTSGDYELQVTNEKMHIAAHRVKSQDFVDKAELFAKIVLKYLEIREIDRAGLRQVFSRPTKSKEETFAEFAELGLIRIPDGKYFGVEGGKAQEGEYSVKWENEALGTNLRVRTHWEKIRLDVGPNWRREVPIADHERTYLLVDSDFYTKVPMLIEQFSTKDWIENAVRVVRRDTPKFLSSGKAP